MVSHGSTYQVLLFYLGETGLDKHSMRNTTCAVSSPGVSVWAGLILSGHWRAQGLSRSPSRSLFLSPSRGSLLYPVSPPLHLLLPSCLIILRLGAALLRPRQVMLLVCPHHLHHWFITARSRYGCSGSFCFFFSLLKTSTEERVMGI